MVALDAERFKENMEKGAKGMAAEGRAIVAGLPLGKQVRPARPPARPRSPGIDSDVRSAGPRRIFPFGGAPGVG